MSDRLKRLAAEKAAECELRPGMRLGLGTGSTARQFVEVLGRRILAGESYSCVPTSEATRVQAESLGIPLTTLEAIGEIDLCIDGADEFDPGLNLVKGGGGAHLREKMVALRSRRMVVIADASKRVARLGAFPLPIEITPFAHPVTARAVEALCAQLGIAAQMRQRLTTAGAAALTDNGNLIYDCVNDGIADPAALAEALDRLTGLIEHGLFVGLCSAVYLASDDGVAVMIPSA